MILKKSWGQGGPEPPRPPVDPLLSGPGSLFCASSFVDLNGDREVCARRTFPGADPGLQSGDPEPM